MAGIKSKGWGGGKARKGKEKPLPNPLPVPTAFDACEEGYASGMLVVIVSIAALVRLLPSRLLSLVS